MSNSIENFNDKYFEYTNLNETIADLDKNIKHYQFIGYIGLTITVFLFLALSFFVYKLFEDSLSTNRKRRKT